METFREALRSDQASAYRVNGGFDGGFEAETTGTTLDWKIRQAEGVEVF